MQAGRHLDPAGPFDRDLGAVRGCAAGVADSEAGGGPAGVLLDFEGEGGEVGGEEPGEEGPGRGLLDWRGGPLADHLRDDLVHGSAACFVLG